MSTVCCRRGPRGPAGTQGVQGPPGDDCQSLTLSDSEGQIVSSPAGETILFEYAVDYRTLANLPFPWGFYLGYAAASTLGGKVRLRVGATSPGSTAGSTVVSCKDILSAAAVQEVQYGTVAAEPATGIVQLTGEPSANATLILQGISLQIGCETPGRSADTVCP